MRELLSANDPVFLSWVQAVLSDAGIAVFELDTHMSILEGSASAIPRRMMVADADYESARRILRDAEAALGQGDVNRAPGEGPVQEGSGQEGPVQDDATGDRGQGGAASEPAAIPAADPKSEEISEDGFLDQRLHLLQPRTGYRAAIDPVFLAAAVPAVAGERALDVGAGVGVASLLLAWRVPGLRVSGLERESGLLRLAMENARRNGLGPRADFMVGDLARPPTRLAPGSFDHVLANPPYLEAGRAHASPVSGRASAMIESGEGLDAWIAFALRMARDKGSVTLIHRADRLDDLLAGLRGRLGGLILFPLWPDRGSGPAGRVIVQGRKGSKAPLRLAKGLVLHEEGGRFTPEAEAILRHGAGLSLTG